MLIKSFIVNENPSATFILFTEIEFATKARLASPLDLKNPDDFKTAVQIYNERESFVAAYDAQFKKTNVGKDSKFKKEESRTSWISSAYMGSLSLQKNGPANWNREKGNGTVMKANGITDGATEELLNNKLKAAKTPEEKAHYEKELKMWNKFKGYHDTYLVYTNDKGHSSIFHISNKKSDDLDDPQNNTFSFIFLVEMEGVEPSSKIRSNKPHSQA